MHGVAAELSDEAHRLRPELRDGLEHVAQSKEPRGMSSVSDTSAKEQGSQWRPRDQAGRAVIRKFAHARSVIHLSNLIQRDAVNAPCEERWQGEQSTQVSRSKEEILVSAHLVLTISI
jgi:hypothetical protein